MPVSNFSQAQVEKIAAWLRAKFVRTQCPACGSRNRHLSDIISVPLGPEGEASSQGSSVSMVRLACSNRAYVSLFEAIRILGQED